MKKIAILFSMFFIGFLLILNIQSIRADSQDLTLKTSFVNQGIIPESQPAAYPCFYFCSSGWILRIKCQSEFFCTIVLAGNVEFEDECYEF